MTRAILVLGVAISISFAAAWMSVVGMLAIFPGAGWLIVSTMIALEAAKVISAEWLHSNWKSERVSRLHKGYLVSAVVALSLITNLGIYGYLAKGHLEAQAENAPVALEIAQKEERIKQLQGDLERYTEQQRQLSDTQNAFLRSKNDNRVGRDALRARQSMSAERNAVQTNIDTVNAEINKINQELVPLKVKTSAVDAKLGPIKFLGFKDPEVAVRVIMLLLMVAFDPLAIVLMISGTITLGEWAESRRKKNVDDIGVAEKRDEEARILIREDGITVVSPVIEVVNDDPLVIENDAETISSIDESEVLENSTPITDDMFDKWKELTDDLEVNLEDELSEEDMDEIAKIFRTSSEEMAEDHPDLAASIAAQDPVPLSIFGGSSTENLLKELHDMNEANRLKYGDFDAVQETDHSVDQKEAEEEAELIVEPTPHEQFISLLERHPEFLTEVIHAVDETRAEAESQQGWLDPNNVKDRA